MSARKKKKSGQWFYRKWVTNWKGEKERITGTPAINTKSAAEAAERAHIARVQVAPAPGSEAREVPTLRDFVEKRWLPKHPHVAGHAITTARLTEIQLRLHILPYLGDYPITEVRGEVLEGWLATLGSELSTRTSRVLGRATVKNIAGTLGVILAKARAWGDIPDVPEIPKVKVPERPVDWLTTGEAALVLDACAPHGHPRAGRRAATRSACA